jgi:hypothetical protein
MGSQYVEQSRQWFDSIWTTATAKPKVYGDAAYGTGPFQDVLDGHDIESGCKTQPPSPPAGGLFPKDRFGIDLDNDTVTCPNQVTVTIRRGRDGGGIASFADACTTCPMRGQCTTSTAGRTVRVTAHEATLARARKEQTDPSLACRLPGHPPQDRTQDRSPHAPSPRRPTSPRPGPHQSRRRLQPPRRRPQPRTARHPRPQINTHRLDHLTPHHPARDRAWKLAGGRDKTVSAPPRTGAPPPTPPTATTPNPTHRPIPTRPE